MGRGWRADAGGLWVGVGSRWRCRDPGCFRIGGDQTAVAAVDEIAAVVDKRARRLSP